MDVLNNAEWIKVPLNTEIAFVGREYVCLGTGCHLLVHVLSTGRRHIYSALNAKTGDGIACYAGHRQIPVLAFAENHFSPRIIILKCPEFSHLKILKDGEHNYVALTFSDHEYLITLSDLPDWKITVWNWRTQERLISELTRAKSPLIQISCSLHTPAAMVEMHEPPFEDLLIWDIHYSFKSCVLVKHEIIMPNTKYALSSTWNTEGGLFVLDNKGCVYMLNGDYGLDLIIDGSGIGNETPCFAWFKGGIILMNTNLDIKHFVKRAGKFTNDWSVCPNKITQFIASPSKEILIGWSANGRIVELDNNKYEFIIHANYASHFLNIGFINPTHEYFVTLSNDNKVHVWRTKTGEKVGKYKITTEIVEMNSNPVYPYIAIGLINGELRFLSICTAAEPVCFTKFLLSHEAITNIVFSEEGNIIVAANLQSGTFFVIKGLPGTEMKILTDIKYCKPILDMCITEDVTNYKLYLLIADEINCDAGKRIILKLIDKENKTKIHTRKFKSTVFFKYLINKNDKLYAIEYCKRKIHTLTLSQRQIKVKARKSGHFMRCIVLNADNNYIYTYGYDGLVIIRSPNLEEILSFFMAHHRMDRGVYKTIVDCMLRYVITLGRDGALVCTKIKVVDKNMERITRENDKKLLAIQVMFEKKTAGFVPEGKYTGNNYLEMKRLLELESETKTYSLVRKEIMDDFLSLKREVRSLLQLNITGLESKRIDTTEFYLHKTLRHHKEKLVIKDCERVVKSTNMLIQAQNKVWSWMKQNFWDTMTIKRSIINGIFSKFYVENYSSYPADEERELMFRCAQMERELEELFSMDNILKPWVPMTGSELQMQLNQDIVTFLDEKVQFLKDLKRETSKLLIGKSVFKSILKYPPSEGNEYTQSWPYSYGEEEINSYSQMHFTKILLHITSREMRQYFNEFHTEILEMKKREMSAIKAKNARLRFILSEIHQPSDHVVDPVWAVEELPDSIIEVRNNEVGTVPYTSPSVELRMREEAAEVERIRLFLHTESFPDHALEQMMHGVLEVRWEDTLKRDITKPTCMLEKSTEDYNADDLRAINEYEKQVEFLKKERERYRGMLQNEFDQVSEEVRVTVLRFNRHLLDLLHLKIKVEIARLQETLIFKRMQLDCRQRIAYNQQAENKIKNIRENETAIEKTQIKLYRVQDGATDCKTANEQLLAREKQLEKNFKRDMQDFSNLVQEQSLKLYKKNPKVQIRSVPSASVLAELGSCVSQERSKKMLTQECLDYLRSLDVLDQYAGVPSTIDEHVYKNICRHRRLRLENELRLKANYVEQTEIDTSVEAVRKILNNFKEKECKLQVDLAQIRKDKLTAMHNKQLQIVIKQGMVEVPLRGLISDFDDAILVCRKEVEDVNASIRKTGEEKLIVLQQKMIYRRGILMKDWEHKKLKMETEYLQEELNYIKNIKVTREMRKYLEDFAHSQPQKETSDIEHEIKYIKESFDREILEKQKEISTMKTRIAELGKNNTELDEQIAVLNMEVCDLAAQINPEIVKHITQQTRNRMVAIIKRGILIKTLQEQRNEILVLQTELELLRLKTYPTLKFKTVP